MVCDEEVAMMWTDRMAKIAQTANSQSPILYGEIEPLTNPRFHHFDPPQFLLLLVSLRQRFRTSVTILRVLFLATWQLQESPPTTSSLSTRLSTAKTANTFKPLREIL